ncbi:MAG: SCO family protein [Gammaproteobacteria bacterium]|nr:SCO family protein [Gammaproteobacteria bacterium]
MAQNSIIWIKRGGILLLLGGILGLGFILADYLTRLGSSEIAVAPGTESTIGGPFTLVNADGRTLTQADFSDRHSLIFFGFTHCPHVCPSTLERIAATLAGLGEQAEQLHPLFITVDPERDTPARLADYRKAFDPRIQMLTGSPEQIARVAKAYQVSYAKVALKSGDYTMDHTAALYLMSPGNQLLESFTQGVAPEEMIRTIRPHLGD